MDLKQEVQILLESGVLPIQVVTEDVCELSSKNPFAYRARLNLSSLSLGTLSPDEYTVVAERCHKSIRLADRTLIYAKELIQKLLAENARFDWISMYIGEEVLSKTEFVAAFKGTFSEEEQSKIAIELSSRVVNYPEDRAKQAIKELKQLGVKIILTDFGDEYCPLVKLMEYGFDMAILHPSLIEKLKQEQTQKAAQAVISYAKLLGMSLIAPKISLEDAPLCDKAGCRGFISVREDE